MGKSLQLNQLIKANHIAKQKSNRGRTRKTQTRKTEGSQKQQPPTFMRTYTHARMHVHALAQARTHTHVHAHPDAPRRHREASHVKNESPIQHAALMGAHTTPMGAPKINMQRRWPHAAPSCAGHDTFWNKHIAIIRHLCFSVHFLQQTASARPSTCWRVWYVCCNARRSTVHKACGNARQLVLVVATCFGAHAQTCLILLDFV